MSAFRSIRSHIAFVVALGATYTASNSALATDVAPRTPVLWDGAACMTIVDRSQTQIVNIPYGIPNEDTMVNLDDEVADSRTHQFFAMCRDSIKNSLLTRWITQADVDAAALKPMIEFLPPTPEDILETACAWEGCWTRINADDERRPITFEMADMGVDWDVSAIDPGVYVVNAFTWHPALSTWSPGRGFYKIVDSAADLPTSPPGVALTTPGLMLPSSDPMVLQGCAHAMEGSTISVAWRSYTETGWHYLTRDQPLQLDANGNFRLDLVPPAEGAIHLFVEVEDPMQRTFKGFVPGEIIIFAAPGCNANNVGQDCEDTTGGDDDGGDEPTSTTMCSSSDTSSGDTSTDSSATSSSDDETSMTATDTTASSSASESSSATSGASSAETGSTTSDSGDATGGTDPGADADSGDSGTCNCTSTGDPRTASLAFFALLAVSLRPRRTIT